MLTDLQKALTAKQKLQITVWDPGDESVEYTFPSYVMEAAGLMFKAAPSNIQQTKILPLMRKDIVVGVVLETYPNPFIFYPVIHSLPQGAGDGYWLRIPSDPQIEVIQRRRHVRIPMVIPFELDFQLGPKWVAMQARTEDVSGGGMRFTSLKLFPKGQELKVHLQLNPTLPVMHIDAKVVFSTENRLLRQPDDLYATACQFQNLDDAQEMMIVRECFRRELKLKQ